VLCCSVLQCVSVCCSVMICMRVEHFSVDVRAFACMRVCVFLSVCVCAWERESESVSESLSE